MSMSVPNLKRIALFGTCGILILFKESIVIASCIMQPAACFFSSKIVLSELLNVFSCSRKVLEWPGSEPL